MRRAIAVPAVLALALVVLPSPAGAAKGPTAADVERAQQRANAAAARLARAETVLARAEGDVKDLERQAAGAATRLRSLETQVRNMAVRRYVQGGNTTVWMGEGDLTEVVRGDAMVRSLTQQRTDSIDAHRALREELGETREMLGGRLADRRAAVRALRADQARIAAELSRLAAAQRAYEARLKAERARASRGRRGAVASRTSLDIGRILGSGPWICPVQGPRAFTNDWGQPRSGGRVHQGNDILAPRGTPVVANVAGNVRPHNSSRGGISYYLAGEDGNTYFGTHLSGLSGARGRVAAGTVIGYVGNTGNAGGGPPHLHFEVHPGGGRPVNPYPLLSRHC